MKQRQGVHVVDYSLSAVLHGKGVSLHVEGTVVRLLGEDDLDLRAQFSAITFVRRLLRIPRSSRLSVLFPWAPFIDEVWA